MEEDRMKLTRAGRPSNHEDCILRPSANAVIRQNSSLEKLESSRAQRNNPPLQIRLQVKAELKL